MYDSHWLWGLKRNRPKPQVQPSTKSWAVAVMVNTLQGWAVAASSLVSRPHLLNPSPSPPGSAQSLPYQPSHLAFLNFFMFGLISENFIMSFQTVITKMAPLHWEGPRSMG